MHVVKRCPGVHLENVDVDQNVVGLARDFFGFDAHVEVSDALRAVESRAAEGKGYDAVIVDCFTDKGVPPSCKNQRFVKALAALVRNTGGVVLQHVWGREVLAVFKSHFSSAYIEEAGLEPIIVATV